MKSRIILALVAALPLIVCGQQVTLLVADPEFLHGFDIWNAKGKKTQIAVRDKSNAPLWHIRQHHAKSNLAAVLRNDLPDGEIQIRDRFATLATRPAGGRPDLLFGIDGNAEYGGKYHIPGDPWPHLFIRQTVGWKGGHLAERAPVISAIERLDFQMDLNLVRFDKLRPKGYTGKTHANQCLLYFTIQNLNPESIGYGDYYWFGIRLFDDRVKRKGVRAKMDAGHANKKGTDKMIYTIDGRDFSEKPVNAGGWVQLSGDLLPHVKAGLEWSWKNGSLPDSKNLSDYGVGTIVLGWEVSTLDNVAMAVDDLQVNAVITAPLDKKTNGVSNTSSPAP